MEYLKVSSKSSPASVAGAIAGLVKDGVPVNMQCVGAGAVNQAIKAYGIMHRDVDYVVKDGEVIEEKVLFTTTYPAIRAIINYGPEITYEDPSTEPSVPPEEDNIW